MATAKTESGAGAGATKDKADPMVAPNNGAAGRRAPANEGMAIRQWNLYHQAVAIWELIEKGWQQGQITTKLKVSARTVQRRRAAGPPVPPAGPPEDELYVTQLPPHSFRDCPVQMVFKARAPLPPIRAGAGPSRTLYCS